MNTRNNQCKHCGQKPTNCICIPEFLPKPYYWEAQHRKTLRRRITDKLCKNRDFFLATLGLAIERGEINYADLLSSEDVKEFLI